MRGVDGTEAEPGALTPEETEVLPGAAAQPKAEWELQLEAEEEAERAKTEPTEQAAAAATTTTEQS